MWLAYIAFFTSALALSAILTAAAVKIAPRIGFTDKPAARKIHTRPMPLGGGGAIILTMAAVIAGGLAAAAFIDKYPGSIPYDEEIAGYLAGIFASIGQLGSIAAGGLVLAVMGLIDDKRGITPWTKLLFQIAAAMIVVAGGVRVTLFLPWPVLGWALTVAWLVFAVNSFNLLDNMDGLSSGVALIISAVFFVICIETGQIFIAAMLAVFAGAVLGFLVFNFPPARIFMGDTGSYFLGYVLGVTAVLFTFVPEETKAPSLLPLVLPFILFAVPLYDTISVIVIRIREGRHPFQADRRHFSHRLNDLGLSKTEAVMTIYAATLATAFPALYLYQLQTSALIGAVVQAVLVLMLIAILEHAGARKIR